ncbi:MAG: sulfurtransferase [Halomonadaceae bacterium]|nr:MAG: sulfurtransferase [Halomonadaceae bacterium]
MKNTLEKVLQRTLLSTALTLTPLWAQAQTAEQENQQIQTLSATAAYELLQTNPRAVLVDVRDPIEIKFTGFATPTAIHVPWALADRDNFDEAVKTWPMVSNSDFKSQIKQRLDALGVAQDDPVIVMCRSGARSEPGARVIASLGFSESYSINNGFEGEAVEQGDHKGMRITEGWRNSGLPWSYQINPDAVMHPED